MFEWNWEPGLLIGLALLTGGYLLCVVGPFRAWFPGSNAYPASRVQLFLLGVLALFIAFISPVDRLGGVSLTMHMVQHMLLTLIAPPLLLLGTPGWLPRPVLRLPLVLPIARWITAPIVAFLLFNATFLFWHVPTFYQLAHIADRFHALEHVLFLLTGILSWWPVLSPMDELPRRHPLVQTVFLFFQSLPTTVLGALIAFAPFIIYPYYSIQPQVLGLSVMDDQQLAGLIMWVPGSLVYFGALTIVFVSWLNRDEGPRRRPRAAAR